VPAPAGSDATPAGESAGSSSAREPSAVEKSRDLLLAGLSTLWEWSRPLWIPLIPGLFAVAVAYVLWFAADERQYQTIIQLVNAQAGWLQTEMLRDMDAREEAIGDLARRMATAPSPDAKSWEAATGDLIAGEYQFRAIAWMDTARAPVYVSPPEERVLTAFDPRDDAVRQVAVDEALGALQPGRATIVSVSVVLAGGGREVLICAPVPSRDHPRGYIVAALRARDLLDTMLRRAFARGYTVAVYEGSFQLFGPVWMYGGPEVFVARYTEVRMGELQWSAQVWPSEDTYRTLHSTAPTAILVLGMILAFLASVLVYVLRSRRGT
jgi:sensor domain CHASE-containing protein